MESKHRNHQQLQSSQHIANKEGSIQSSNQGIIRNNKHKQSDNDFTQRSSQAENVDVIEANCEEQVLVHDNFENEGVTPYFRAKETKYQNMEQAFNLDLAQIQPSQELCLLKDSGEEPINEILHEANPILPPNKHTTIKQEFTLKFNGFVGTQKLNQTAFQNHGYLLTPLKNNHLHQKRNAYIHKINSNRQLSSQHQDQCEKSREEIIEEETSSKNIKNMNEFTKILMNKCLVYKRIDNRMINSIAGGNKDSSADISLPVKIKNYASLFVNCKISKNLAKQVPLYEHLAQTYNIKGKIRFCEEKYLYSTTHNVDNYLIFNSAFESGNLLSAFKNPNAPMSTYELFMQNDINTKGCTQWFHFTVSSPIKGKIKFRLMNFYKPTSLYERGMKILASLDGLEWKRTGIAITYTKLSLADDKCSYVLEFLYQFDHINKDIHFCYGYPYTYNQDLLHFINKVSPLQVIEIHHKKTQIYANKSVLCMSNMNNPVYMLTITSNSSKRQRKPLIYVIGRQHPGETPSSFILEGFVQCLLSSKYECQELREKYEFRIVPMVNVDGVISGNYRSNISGNDVNRQWMFPSKKLHPEIYYLKKQILNYKKNVAFFLDIHAHSRKMNSFFYGSKGVRHQNRQYPFVCSKLCKFIEYADCSFYDDPTKKTTARVILENQLAIANSLTFQASFYGWVDHSRNDIFVHFKIEDFKNIGENLALGMYYSLIGLEIAKNFTTQEDKKIDKNVPLPKFLSHPNKLLTNSKEKEKEKLILKNCQKILQKWNKNLEKQLKQEEAIENETEISEGSSLDPEHFELKEDEEMNLFENNGFLGEIKTGEESQQDKDVKNEKGCEGKSKRYGFEMNESFLLDKNTNLLGLTSNEVFMFSPKKKIEIGQAPPMTLKDLESQLQIRKESSFYSKNNAKINNLNNSSLSQTKNRYVSLSVDPNNDRNSSGNPKNYKQEVMEMKKALKYLIETKSSDYEQYKGCFKDINNECMTTLVPDKTNRRIFSLQKKHDQNKI